MTMISVLTIDGECVAHGLQQASEKLDGANGQVVLDFSSVRRIDPDALSALHKLAGVAEDKAVKVALRGVSVDLYKVLKLVRLVPRFSFLSSDESGHHRGDRPGERRAHNPSGQTD